MRGVFNKAEKKCHGDHRHHVDNEALWAEEEVGTPSASLEPVRNEYVVLMSLKHAVESVLHVYDQQKQYLDTNGLRVLIEYLRKELNETVG